jgi:hypothetical protein
LEVLRTNDRQLVSLSRSYLEHNAAGLIDWPNHEIAYAQFPVMVRKEKLPHTIIF